MLLTTSSAGAVVAGLKIVASAAVLTVASQCARNMVQTARIVSTTSHTNNNNNGVRLPRLPSLAMPSPSPSLLSSAAAASDAQLPLPPPMVVQQLQQMKRNELLELFCQSSCSSCNNSNSNSPESIPTSPTAWLCGDWDGCLLDNNSVVMTMISTLLTHKLFGFGFQRWNGKAFHATTTATTTATSTTDRGDYDVHNTTSTTTTTTNIGMGINRFIQTTSNKGQGAGTIHRTRQRHTFSYSVQPSRLQRGTESIQLDYSNHSNRHWLFSPWHTMMDELRLVNMNENDDTTTVDVLIGMGCVAWGGGFLNAAPFCLWRTRRTSSSLFSVGIDIDNNNENRKGDD